MTVVILLVYTFKLENLNGSVEELMVFLIYFFFCHSFYLNVIFSARYNLYLQYLEVLESK